MSSVTLRAVFGVDWVDRIEDEARDLTRDLEDLRRSSWSKTSSSSYLIKAVRARIGCEEEERGEGEGGRGQERVTCSFQTPGRYKAQAKARGSDGTLQRNISSAGTLNTPGTSTFNDPLLSQTNQF